LDRGAGRFLFDLIDGSERWGGVGAAALAAALELGGNAGDYEIVRQLPEAHGEFQYRIKSAHEPQERAVKESQLRKSSEA
jgi:hypothetical protein